jgi:tetratricopeptide (TPR) repeat protein
VTDLTFGLLGALLATNQPLAVSNLVQQQTGVALPVVDANDPAERDLRTVMMDDDNALDEVNSWIQTNQVPRSDTNAVAQFNQKIRNRFDDVKHGYDNFLRRHPDSARGYLAYGTFLEDIGDEDGAKVQYDNSRQLDPKNPAVWNQLANYEGEHGELTNAFTDYAEAIRLDPGEPVYYQNFATTVYLYRKDAREFYRIAEPQVFDKALGLYRQAMKLKPDDLVLATDYAESYYGIKPLRTNDALAAWTNAFNICQDENEREGVQLHLARVKISAGLYDEAQAHLDAITNASFADMRRRLERSLEEHKNPPTNDVVEVPTNLPAAAGVPPVATNAMPAGTNSLPVSTNVINPSTNLDLAPPVLRGQKP